MTVSPVGRLLEKIYPLDVRAMRWETGQPTRGPVTTFGGAEWLILMRMVADDRFGNPEKHNGAFSADRNFQTDDGTDRERISFDSAMNALPGAHYASVTGLSEVTFLANLDAPEWLVQIMRRRGTDLPIIVAEAAGSGPAALALPVAIRPDRNDRFYATITYRGTLTTHELAFATKKPTELPKIGLSITTYNKPEYLRPNLDIIRGSGAYQSGFIDLLVVNNGDPIAELPGDISVEEPGNIGGTGGFLIAQKHFREKAFRHFIIMDDDIVIPDDLIDRFYALSTFSQGQHIGALAEIQNMPERIIKEQGADVDPSVPFALELHNEALNVHGRKRGQLYDLQDSDYSGWWALMVDLSGPEIALPPFLFIKRDDISFGYESRVANFPTVVVPSLSVAHGEEGAETYFYYDIRNDLIMRARNNDTLNLSTRSLLVVAATLFLTYRLDRQRMYSLALSDFLRGPARLAALPVAQKLQQLRRIAARPIPLPEGHPELTSEKPVPRLKMLSAWIWPPAWRVPNPVPIVEPKQRACVTVIGGYIMSKPFTEVGFEYRRRFASIPSFLYAVFLIAVIALRRRSLVARYRDWR